MDHPCQKCGSLNHLTDFHICEICGDKHHNTNQHISCTKCGSKFHQSDAHRCLFCAETHDETQHECVLCHLFGHSPEKHRNDSCGDWATIKYQQRYVKPPYHCGRCFGYHHDPKQHDKEPCQVCHSIFHFTKDHICKVCGRKFAGNHHLCRCKICGQCETHKTKHCPTKCQLCGRIEHNQHNHREWWSNNQAYTKFNSGRNEAYKNRNKYEYTSRYVYHSDYDHTNYKYQDHGHYCYATEKSSVGAYIYKNGRITRENGKW